MNPYTLISAGVTVVCVFANALHAAHEIGSQNTSYAAVQLTSDQAAQDVALLRRAIQEIHPGYGRFTSASAMDSLFDQLEHNVQDGTTDTDLVRGISVVLGHLRCDHTIAELPDAMSTHRNTVPSYLPFTFRLFGSQMYIDQPIAEHPTLKRGDEVISINGIAVRTILADVAPLVPVDGWTDSSRRCRLEYSSEFLGDAIDHFWPMLYGWPDTWSIEIQSRASGRRETISASPVTYVEWLAVADAQGRYRNFRDEVTVQSMGDDAAVLTIGTFVNYRDPVEPSAVFDPIFDQLAADSIQHLIIDLRACGGGSDDVPRELLTYLIPDAPAMGKQRPWVRATNVGDLRPHLSTWDESIFDAPAELFRDLNNGYFELLMPLSAAPATNRHNVFTGDVTILCGAANSSGATMFIAVASDHHNRLVVIGEPTGGSTEGPTAGVITFLRLPHSDITVRVPLLRSWANVSQPVPGHGVQPDLRIEMDVDDWLNDRDVVLEAAFARDRAKNN
ncbi:MAG: S41 family peptidase [Planctomycetota bacterium]